MAGGAPTLQSASNFNTSYNQVCGTGAENSTACLNLVYNEVRSHFAYTDYLNKENEAVEDVLDSLENDWAFAVNRFASIEPQAAAFVSNNSTTMSALVSSLNANATSLVNQVNPVLQWAHKNLQLLLEADALDTANITNATDAAVQRLLYQAMTVGQIFPHQVNMYAKNSSAYADRYFNTEFFRVKNAINSKYSAIQAQIQAIQSRLQAQQRYISNQTNFFNVSISQLNDSMVNSVPKRFSDLRTALATTLRDRINQRLRSQSTQQTSNALSNQLSTYATSRLQALNTSIYADMDAAFDLIEARMNATMGVALAEAQQSVSNFTSTNAVGVSSLGNIASLLAPFTSAAGKAAYPFMLSDADLGANSVIQFRLKRDQVKAAVPSASNAIATLIKRITNQLDSYAFGVGVQLGRALDGLSTTDSGQTAQGLTEWTKFANGMYAKGLNDLMANFHTGLQAIQDAVLFRVTGATVAKGQSLASASVKGLLGADLDFVPSDLLVSGEAAMAGNRTLLVAGVQDRLSRMMTTLNAAGRTEDLSNVRKRADSSIDGILNYIASAFQGVKDDDSTIQTTIQLHQVDEPIAAAVAAFQQVQDQVQSLVRRNAVVTSRLVDLENILISAAQDTHQKLSTIDTAIVTKARAMENMFSIVGNEMKAAINDFVAKYVSALPAATGLAQLASDRTLNLTTIANYIQTSGMEIQALTETQQRRIQAYLDGLSRVSSEFAEAQSEISKRDSITPPDFAAMNGQIKNLGDRLDADAEWQRQSNLIASQVAEVTQKLNDRNLELSKALAAGRKESTARDSAIDQVQAQSDARNSSFKLLGEAYDSRIGGVISTLNLALDQYAADLSLLTNTSESQKDLQTRMLGEEISDLLNQVRSAAPSFLAQYESEKVADLLKRLGDINATLPSVVLSGSPSGSFLHQLTSIVSPSAKLESIVEMINDKANVEPIRASIDLAMKEISAGISKHRVPTVQVPQDLRDDEILAFGNASDSILERLVKLVSRLEIKSEEKSHQLDGMASRNLTELSKAANVVTSVIDQAASHSYVQSLLDSLRNRVKGFNSSIAAWNSIADGIGEKRPGTLTRGTDDPTPKIKIEVDTTAENSWYKHFISESESGVNRRISEQVNHVNSTLTQISEIQNQLEQIAIAQDKLESDFDVKIVPKLRPTDATTQIAIARLRKELVDLSSE